MVKKMQSHVAEVWMLEKGQPEVTAISVTEKRAVELEAAGFVRLEESPVALEVPEPVNFEDTTEYAELDIDHESDVVPVDAPAESEYERLERIHGSAAPDEQPDPEVLYGGPAILPDDPEAITEQE